MLLCLQKLDDFYNPFLNAILTCNIMSKGLKVITYKHLKFTQSWKHGINQTSIIQNSLTDQKLPIFTVTDSNTECKFRLKFQS